MLNKILTGYGKDSQISELYSGVEECGYSNTLQVLVEYFDEQKNDQLRV